MRSAKIAIWVWGLIALAGCVESFTVLPLSFERAVVVEGRLTNRQQPHYVRLSYTRPIDETRRDPITGAEVWVEDSNGNRFDYAEAEPGQYWSDSTVAGEVGETYHLIFVTGEGSRYVSDPQPLLASPPIDRIYPEYAERLIQSTEEVLPGIQFFIDTQDQTNTAQYFKYEWQETYEVRAPFPSLYEASFDPDTVIFRQEPVNLCYATANSSNIILGTTANLTENRLSGMDVRYITSQTDQLRYAYSLLVRQYVISATAFAYYRAIVANNESTGSLFDQQLGAVVGNIRSEENPEEVVLGFFEVSGISERRAFFLPTDLDSRYPWPQDQYPCPPNSTVNINTIDSLSYYVRGQGYEVLNNPYGQFSFSASLAPRFCTDCRFRGSNQKPEFWIY